MYVHGERKRLRLQLEPKPPEMLGSVPVRKRLHIEAVKVARAAQRKPRDLHRNLCGNSILRTGVLYSPRSARSVEQRFEVAVTAVRVAMPDSAPPHSLLNCEDAGRNIE